MASSSKAMKEKDLLSRSGGAYIPPMKLKMMMQQQVADKAGASYQRLSWEALKKSIHGFVNKVNTPNIANVIRELLGENLIRGRGLLCRSLIQCQTFSPTYTNVFAALVAVINTKFPAIGELLLRRLIIAFRKGYKRRDKHLCLSSTRFIAHLVNQQVAHEVLALEILMLLLEQPTDDSVEVAISFLKECGARLKQVSPRGLVAITDRLRAVLHEAQIDPRTQYMIEVMFAVIKDNFKDHPIVVSELDLVEEGDQFTHMISLEDEIAEERELDVFKFDDNFLDNEAKYEEIKREILGDEDEEGEEELEEEENEEDEEGAGGQEIIDNTELNMGNLRRTIYLAIQSSLNFEEAAHKLLKMTLRPEQEQELCYMVVDCCAQLRTYEKFYGLLAERFCKINQKYVGPFEQIFKEQYDTCHRLELMKLRNVAKLLAHLLFSDAINWTVLSCITLTEDTTTSSGRIFLKILFQELAEHMGVVKLNERLQDPTLKESFSGIFPTDSPKNMRFSINFFTAIGLGGLTDELREVLKNAGKPTAQLQQKLDQLADNETLLSIQRENNEKGSKVKKEKRSKDSDDERSRKKKAKKERSRGDSENEPTRVKQERISVERETRRQRNRSPDRKKKRRSPSRSRSRSYESSYSKKHSSPVRRHRRSRSPSPAIRSRRLPSRSPSPAPRRNRSPVDHREYRSDSRSRRNRNRSPNRRIRRSRSRSRSVDKSRYRSDRSNRRSPDRARRRRSTERPVVKEEPIEDEQISRKSRSPVESKRRRQRDPSQSSSSASSDSSSSSSSSSSESSDSDSSSSSD